MPLPKISHPTFEIEIPSTKTKITLRPFLVKEEKILLMAKSSEDDKDVMKAVKQVVNNCVIDDKFDINAISLFDLEYIFIKLRAASVSDVVEVSYRDFEDEKIYEFDVDLNKVEVIFPEKLTNKITINESAGFTMKYPQTGLYEDKDFAASGDEALFQLIVRSVDKIYDDEEMYDAKNFSLKEIEDFLENLDVNTFENVRKFITNQPYVFYEIKYKNSKGNNRTIELKTLSDFFTLR